MVLPRPFSWGDVARPHIAPPAFMSLRRIARRKSETAVILVSDLQFGRLSSTYNPQRSLDALRRVRDAIINIRTDHLYNYIFDQLIVCYLGDIVDGDCIFPGHAWEASIGAMDQVTMLSEKMDEIFHLPLAEVFGKVTLIGVPGNHGRPTPRPGQAAPRSNYDIQLYNNFSLLYKRNGPIRCAFDYQVSIEKSWGNSGKINYVYIKGYMVRGWKMLLYHGHGIFSWAGIPFYGIANRIKNWFLSFGEFNIFCMGDKHVAFDWPISPHLQVFLNGTALTGDEWAAQRIGMPAGQIYWFFGISNKRPVSFRYAIPTSDHQELEFITINGDINKETI